MLASIKLYILKTHNGYGYSMYKIVYNNHYANKLNSVWYLLLKSVKINIIFLLFLYLKKY